MKKINSYSLTIWLLFVLLGYLGLREFHQINVLAYVGDQHLWDSRRFIAFLIVSILSGAVWLAAGFILILRGKTLNISKIQTLPPSLRIFFVGLLVLLPGLLKWILPLPANFTLGYWQELLLIFCIAVLSSALMVKPMASQNGRLLVLAAFFLAGGAAHAALVKLCQVTSYPFGLYWSEGNRFFDYSTLFGSFRYLFPAGEKIYAFISWGMQLPWAPPFLLPNLSIAAFRLWYQLVWIIPPMLLGWLAAWKKPFRNTNILFAAVFAGWAFLFVDQGPVYAPLILAAILTILAVRAKLPIGIVLIMLASYYARSSRWTWAYSPGLWSGLLALLNESQPGFSKDGLKKLVKPIVLGLSGYAGGHLLPNLPRLFTQSQVSLLPNVVSSASRQPLLWERLLPNPTYPSGILYGLLWAALPIILLLAYLLISRIWKINALQVLASLAVAGVFLVSGLVASVKIGGGSNLHNLDNFLVTLLLISASALAFLREKKNAFSSRPVLSALTCIALAAPVTFGLQGGARLELPSSEHTQVTLSTVQAAIAQAKDEGEILFIDQRQLLTFGLLEKVTLIDEYEKKYLMDQALTGNAAYFDGFYQDLKDQRFTLIVNEPSNYILRGSEHSFGEENDAYVKWVTVPLLCTFEPVFTSRENGIELLVPRQNPLMDPECEPFLK